MSGNDKPFYGRVNGGGMGRQGGDHAFHCFFQRLRAAQHGDGGLGIVYLKNMKKKSVLFV